MLLECSHIHKEFSGDVVIEDATFHINEQERVAIVGANGAGKTTLLRIIMGELDADSGEILRKNRASFGYLPQQQGYHSDNTIYEELLAVKSDVIEMDRQIRELERAMAGASGPELEALLARYHKLQTAFESGDGYSYKSRVLGIINGLGFGGDVMHQCINELSGGQKTRVALGKLLLTEPELLILDEPTNHLDVSSIRWLETYLTSYRGSVLVVSHDRYFLDVVAGKVVEIERGGVTVFTGNYSSYAEKKAVLRESLIRRYYNQQQQIRHQEAVIEKLKSFNREKSIRRAESREKMLDKIERLEKPVEQEQSIHFTLTPSQTSGRDVLQVENFSKSFGDNHLFSDVNFEIKRGERVAVLGQNGTGKTTLLKMIIGMEPVDTGTAVTGANVEIGYYDQEHNVLHEDKTIFDEVRDAYPDLDNTAIRNVLAAFLFTGEDVFKPIRLLSGGEKGRVSLALLMLSRANFLLLDEPTNHLDIASREILEDALNRYEGTVLYVSHDRYFVKRTATRIFDLTGHRLLSYAGDYSYYLEKKDTVENLYLAPDSEKNTVRTDSAAKQDWKAQKEIQAKRRRLENKFSQIEKQIETLEADIAALDEELIRPEYSTDAARLTELSVAREEKETALNEAMEQWETLAEQLEGQPESQTESQPVGQN